MLSLRKVDTYLTREKISIQIEFMEMQVKFNFIRDEGITRVGIELREQFE